MTRDATTTIIGPLCVANKAISHTRASQHAIRASLSTRIHWSRGDGADSCGESRAIFCSFAFRPACTLCARRRTHLVVIVVIDVVELHLLALVAAATILLRLADGDVLVRFALLRRRHRPVWISVTHACETHAVLDLRVTRTIGARRARP